MQAIEPAMGWANRILEREDWARERLSMHEGRTFRILCGPFDSALLIVPRGMLSLATGAADLTLTLSPVRVPTLLAHPERWADLVAADGDRALAATLADLAQTLPWFVEQAFARAFGPLIGTRLADAGRAMLDFPEHAAQSFGGSLASYASDESGLGVRAPELVEFSAQVEALAKRVDALAQRLEHLPAGDSTRSASDGTAS